jgi:AraC family transcriptional regulator
VHEGSYQTLGDTWSELMGGWLPESDYRIAGVPFECYLNMPGSVPDKELRTELFIPVHPE